MGTDDAASGVGQTAPGGVALAVHGGAGALGRDRSAAADAACRAGLAAALQAGHAVLEEGGASEDAVVEAVAVLEDSSAFNAGRGAVYTTDATQELEAAVMSGPSRNAGAAADLTHVRNPVRLARAVLMDSPHVLLVGRSAEAFAAEHDLDLVEAAYFHSERSLRALLQETSRGPDREGGQDTGGVADTGGVQDTGGGQDTGGVADTAGETGTVGAVALDRRGRLAAATSTGGVTGKAPGRVGDSPLVGAGTYADGRVAVSTTGLGEYFVRAVAAHEVAALVAHAGCTIAEAAARVVADVAALGGQGGILALDAAGRLAAPFDTEAMPRGWVTRVGEVTVVSRGSA